MAMSNRRRFIWNDRYSVGVQIIDDQHKKLFSTMNELLDGLERRMSEQHLAKIARDLIDYKKQHFATEEKYFDQFHYEDKEAHKVKHWEFSQKLDELNFKNPDFSLTYAYELVAFLEDWFVEHVMKEDQRYVECFHENGLK